MTIKETKRRESVLRESFKLFLSKGYDAVSITYIERAAKVTRGAIFHHCNNKEDLFKHIAEQFIFLFLKEAVLSKHNVKAEEIDYVIPHLFSKSFYEQLNDELLNRRIALTKKRWFTNLTSVGDIGFAAIYVALDELIKTKEIKSREKILLLVPGSSRFSYGTVLLRL